MSRGGRKSGLTNVPLALRVGALFGDFGGKVSGEPGRLFFGLSLVPGRGPVEGGGGSQVARSEHPISHHPGRRKGR